VVRHHHPGMWVAVCCAAPWNSVRGCMLCGTLEFSVWLFVVRQPGFQCVAVCCAAQLVIQEYVNCWWG
jgi:hypothetical protein